MGTLPCCDCALLRPGEVRAVHVDHDEQAWGRVATVFGRARPAARAGRARTSRLDWRRFGGGAAGRGRGGLPGAAGAARQRGRGRRGPAATARASGALCMAFTQTRSATEAQRARSRRRRP